MEPHRVETITSDTEMEPSMNEFLSPQLRTRAYVTDQLNRIQSKRRETEDDSQALDAEELRLKQLWNSSLPINNLPDELLVSIIQLDGEEPICHLPLSMPWIRLMLVCTYWRAVACATPTLWSNIAISGSAAAWLGLCVARSAETILRISLTKPPPEMIGHIARYSDRIEAFAISSPLLRPDPRYIAGSYLGELERPMPILRDLTVDGAALAGRTDINITSAHYPVLRSVHLRHVRILSDINVYAGLRRLSLTACGYRDGLSVTRFLDALRAATRLESLSMSDVLRRFPPSTWPESPPVAFPHLSDFSLHECFRDVRPFMILLRLPPTCSIAVSARPDNSTDEWEEMTFSEMLPETRADTLPTLSSPTAVELIMHRCHYIIRGSSPTHGAIELSMASSIRTNWEHFLGVGLRDIVNVFGAAPVQRLRVTGDHRSSSSILPLASAWREVLEAFPTLGALELCGAGLPSALWEGLRMAESMILQGSGNGKAAAACPNLRTVSVDGRSMILSTGFFESMLDCLRHRAKDGARLEGLHLKELVEHVSYELYED
ncbi:hypothetical protein C8T65DRAFT_286405 [Cerioporus squamosus]|nr:hypothetical protein C8T65DRAFT_286405 [Cerioporus squamosus]